MDKQDLMNALRLIEDYCTNLGDECEKCAIRKHCIRCFNPPEKWVLESEELK